MPIISSTSRVEPMTIGVYLPRFSFAQRAFWAADILALASGLHCFFALNQSRAGDGAGLEGDAGRGRFGLVQLGVASHGESNPFARRVHFQDGDGHVLMHFDEFGWILDEAIGQLADMHQSILVHPNVDESAAVKGS